MNGTHQDIHGVGSGTGYDLFDGSVPSVPWRDKDSGFCRMAARVTFIFAWEKLWFVLEAMMDTSPGNSWYVDLCQSFSFPVS